MNEKDFTTEHTDRPEPWEQSFYQTGSTRPPKSYRGTLAFLLISVIFLSSIVSLQGVMNIQLFRLLSGQEEAVTSVRFIQGGTSQEAACSTEALSVSDLGIEGSILSAFDQQFYGLPQGVYVTQVHPASEAENKGICAGDVLLSIDGVSLTDADVMTAQLSAHQPGDTVQVVIYRGGIRKPVELTVEPEQ